ncbi:MAG TPA: hypothetical protein VFL57_08095, partial [Bryobacteraceae bacterium]|nr:hypothetical protein [Bryobacteraceae bacterium]
SPEMLLRIWREVNSPYLGINMDTGNFAGDPYAGMEMLAPYASIVQAKTYYGGGEWYTLDLDTAGSRAFCARRVSEGGFRSKWKARRRPIRRWRRVSPCCARRLHNLVCCL